MAFTTVAAVVTAYDALGTAALATATAYAAIVALGARPAFPADVLVTTDYTNVVTSQATYDTAYAADQATWLAAVATQKTAEQSVIATLPTGQWVKCTGLANWGAASTQYVSYPLIKTTSANSCTLYLLNSVASAPALPYPSMV
jgi:hypothetical protein